MDRATDGCNCPACTRVRTTGSRGAFYACPFAKKFEEKPPKGVSPKFIHDRERAIDLVHAIERYALVGKPVPAEWADELKDLVVRG